MGQTHTFFPDHARVKLPRSTVQAHRGDGEPSAINREETVSFAETWMDLETVTQREDEMVRSHHRLNGHESEQTQGDGEGQGSLVRHSPWGRDQTRLSD